MGHTSHTGNFQSKKTVKSYIFSIGFILKSDYESMKLELKRGILCTYIWHRRNNAKRIQIIWSFQNPKDVIGVWVDIVQVFDFEDEGFWKPGSYDDPSSSDSSGWEILFLLSIFSFFENIQLGLCFSHFRTCMLAETAQIIYTVDTC